MFNRWGGRKKPLISVVCITYNQEAYIEDAIKGFLCQKTDFPFEVIIHDDASTDYTQKIIDNYYRLYPGIIRPVIQTVNQMSKGVNVLRQLFNMALGEYIAICDGDDFWIDPHKLQTQINEMKNHPKCDISFHSAIAKYESGKNNNRVYKNWFNENKIIGTEEVIVRGGSFCPTSSLIMKREVCDELPTWFYEKASAGDVFLQIYGSLQGGILYINTPMSVKRINTHLSVSDNFNLSLQHKLSHIQKQESCYHMLDEELKYEYNKSISIAISLLYLSYCVTLLKFKDYSNFKIYIEKSWKLAYNNNIKQFVFYHCRNVRIALVFLRLIFSMINIKKPKPLLSWISNMNFRFQRSGK